MSRPYFAGTRDDVPRRGATSSKAGLDLPRRVAGLEQGIPAAMVHSPQAQWTTLHQAWCNNPGTIGDFWMTGSGPVAVNTGNIYALHGAVFPFDPADYAVAGRTLYGRVVFAFCGNSYSPATTVTCYLYGLSASTGTGAQIIPTAAAFLNSGGHSAVAGVNTQKKGTATDISAATAGLYLFSFSNTAGFGANSAGAMGAWFQIRHQ